MENDVSDKDGKNAAAEGPASAGTDQTIPAWVLKGVTCVRGFKALACARISVLMALIVFTLPFMSISCANASEREARSRSLSGVQFMLDRIPNRDGSSKNQLVGDHPNVFLCLAFLAGLAGLVMLVSKGKRHYRAVVWSLVSAGAMLVCFRVFFVSYYELDKVDLVIKTRYGYYWSLILFAAGIVCSLAARAEELGLPLRDYLEAKQKTGADEKTFNMRKFEACVAQGLNLGLGRLAALTSKAGK